MIKYFNDNYKILFALRNLKAILAIFVDSFLVLYFLTLSENNILPLGIYNLVAVITVFLSMFLLRNLCKSKTRSNVLRTGIILDIHFFITILLLRENVIDHVILLGFLFGLKEGIYYSVYNSFESDGITNEERIKYNGQQLATRAILSVVFPLIFGGLIAATGFINSIFFVLIIVIIRILLSFRFKDNNIPKYDKTDLRKFYSKIKKDRLVKQVYKLSVLNGLTYSFGAFHTIIMVYIIRIFNDSMSLGFFTSIFSAMTFFIGILFSKHINPKYHKSIIAISMPFTIISLVIMVLYPSVLTVIIFNFYQTISRNLMTLINDTNIVNISNKPLLKKEYKIEFFLVNDFFLLIGRVTSQSLFILMAFISELYIIPIFIIFLVLFTYNAIKLQKLIDKEKQST